MTTSIARLTCFVVVAWAPPQNTLDCVDQTSLVE